MRISDWSADVCSSDLLSAAEWHDQKAREAELQADREPNPDRKQKFRKRAERHRLYSRQLRKELEHLRELRRHVVINEMRQSLQQQIGRASCRERVCQYV